MRSDTVLLLLHFAEILHYLEKIAFVRFVLVCLGHWSTGSRVAVLGNSMKRSIVKKPCDAATEQCPQSRRGNGFDQSPHEEKPIID